MTHKEADQLIGGVEKAHQRIEGEGLQRSNRGPLCVSVSAFAWAPIGSVRWWMLGMLGIICGGIVSVALFYAVGRIWLWLV